MLPEYEDLVINLKDKIYALVVKLEQEREAKNVLLKEKEELTVRLNDVQREADDLNQKYDNLKLGKVIEQSTQDVHEAKIKINRIVREIDQCIALLNR